MPASSESNVRSNPLPARPLVVGGGIGGLSVAIALHRSSARPLVIERRASPPTGGAGVVLSPNGIRAADAILPALGQAIRRRGVVSGQRGKVGHRSSFVTGQGKVLATATFDGFEERWGAPAVSISRRELHGCLLEQAEALGVEVRYGAALERVEQGADAAVAHLEGGEVVRAELLIGADGVHSKVRPAVLDDGPPTYTGIGAVQGLGPRPPEHPSGFIAYGRRTVLFSAPVDDERLYWVVSAGLPEGTARRWSDAQAQAWIQGRLESWDPALRGVVRARARRPGPAPTSTIAMRLCAGSAAAWCCWATPPTRCSPRWARAPTRRSRMRRCSPMR